MDPASNSLSMRIGVVEAIQQQVRNEDLPLKPNQHTLHSRTSASVLHTFRLVLTSRSSSASNTEGSGCVLLIGIISERCSSNGECNEKARLTYQNRRVSIKHGQFKLALSLSLS
jgi:hypothetical protein